MKNMNNVKQRLGRAVLAAALMVGVSGTAQAAPLNLNLVQEYPDLKAGFLDGSLAGDLLQVNGWVLSFWPSASESFVLDPQGTFQLGADLGTGIGTLELNVPAQNVPLSAAAAVGTLSGSLLAFTSYGSGIFDFLFAVDSTTMAAFSGVSTVGVKLSVDLIDGVIDDGAADVFAVPEPALLALFGAGLAAAIRRRRV
jgi:hypothetical protein